MVTTTVLAFRLSEGSVYRAGKAERYHTVTVPESFADLHKIGRGLPWVTVVDERVIGLVGPIGTVSFLPDAVVAVISTEGR